MLCVIGLGFFFTVVSSLIIAHTSMATAFGPFLAPTIVVMTGFLLRLFVKNTSRDKRQEYLLLIQSISSVGGNVATSIGFTLPMIYFLQPALFASWLADPLYFCLMIGTLCCVAGGLGIWLGRLSAYTLIIEKKLPLPVSIMIHEAIVTQSDESASGGSTMLSKGVILGSTLAFLRDGILSFKGCIVRSFSFFPGKLGKELVFGFEPMFWAIGFIAGMGVACPLIIGLISKYCIVNPLNNHSLYLPYAWFSPFESDHFVQAFCSGLVLVDMVFTLIKFPFFVWKSVKDYSAHSTAVVTDLIKKISDFVRGQQYAYVKPKSVLGRFWLMIEPCIVVTGCIAFLTYFGFSFISQSMLLVLVAIFSYQIGDFSAKIGLVPFGRFTTFIMIPMIILCKLSYLQITLLCVFSNICFALATDLLFSYKVGDLHAISRERIHMYQWLGLCITSVTIGVCLLLLFYNFKIGSPELAAYRAHGRALLIESIRFDYQPVILGFGFGMFLRRMKLNPMLIFGGILMPPQLTIGLAIGASISWLDRKAKEHEAFWSGIFIGDSVFVITSFLIKLLV